MTRMLLPAAAAIAGAALAWRLKPTPAPGPPRVQVDTVYAEAERPHLVKPSLGEKLTTARAKPTQTRIADAPSSAGLQRVEIYCRPPIPLQTSADSGISDIKKSPPAILPDFAGGRDGSKLTLYSTLNDGRRWATDYTARGRIRWESSGDSAIVRGDRLWVRLVRGAPKCGAKMAAHGLVGGLLDRENPLEGAVIAAGVRGLDCLF